MLKGAQIARLVCGGWYAPQRRWLIKWLGRGWASRVEDQSAEAGSREEDRARQEDNAVTAIALDWNPQTRQAIYHQEWTVSPSGKSSGLLTAILLFTLDWGSSDII